MSSCLYVIWIRFDAIAGALGDLNICSSTNSCKQRFTGAGFDEFHEVSFNRLSADSRLISLMQAEGLLMMQDAAKPSVWASSFAIVGGTLVGQKDRWHSTALGELMISTTISC